MRKLVYYVAVSLDGFIARPDGSFDDFVAQPATLQALFGRYPETCPAHVRGALGIAAPAARFDAVVMGAHTHQPALDAGLTSGYPHLQQYVVTHRELPADPTVTRVDGDVAGSVSQLLRLPGRDVWLCGGGNLAGQLLDLVDEVQLKVYPVLLGEGIPLFGGSTPVRQLAAAGSEQLPGGVLLNTYLPLDASQR